MKFANYHHIGKNMNNLGDQVQILTIDYIYQQMGIRKDDIVYIDMNELPHYNGCPVILPVSMPLINYNEHGMAGMFSDKITPVFLGLTLAKDFLLPEEVAYYKNHEPVGCRDERTYQTLCKCGINAYLGGCITVVLPNRGALYAGNGNVFLIEPAKGLREYLPTDIAQNGIFDRHLFYGVMSDPKQWAIDRYKQYASQAALVVTSLLHCAVPCMAMGIPVILARDVVSYRFAWLEALMHIYTPEEYGKINWDVKPIDCEKHKQCVLEFTIKRLYGSQTVEEVQNIHNFYMVRDRKPYIVDAFLPLKSFIDSAWDNTQGAYKYAVWGLTQMAEMVVDYISRNYPNARLCHVYDKQYTRQLRGIVAEHPENIIKYPDETVFVTTVSAYGPAKEFFQKIGRSEDSYALLSTMA